MWWKVGQTLMSKSRIAISVCDGSSTKYWNLTILEYFPNNNFIEDAIESIKIGTNLLFTICLFFLFS